MNDGNVSLTVKWYGFRYSNLKKDNHTYWTNEEYDDTDWHTVEPGNATKPVGVSVSFISQKINRWMEPGDTQYIDVLYLEAYGNKFEKLKIPITTTMVNGNSNLPKAENDGIPTFKSPL